MALAVRFHGAEDPDAPLVGGYAFAKLVELAHLTGQPKPESPKPDVLFALWVQRALVVVGLWHEKTLVGVEVSLVSPSLLGSDLQIAHQVGVFVDPAHRGRGAARMLRGATVAVLRQRRVKVLTVVAAPGSDGYRFSLATGAQFNHELSLTEV